MHGTRACVTTITYFTIIIGICCIACVISIGDKHSHDDFGSYVGLRTCRPKTFRRGVFLQTIQEGTCKFGEVTSQSEKQLW